MMSASKWTKMVS